MSRFERTQSNFIKGRIEQEINQIRPGKVLRVYEHKVAHISIELNKVGGEDTDGTWGIKFDLKTGTFELADSSGFGIESDGSGNFTFHHKTIDFNEVAEDVGPLDL